MLWKLKLTRGPLLKETTPITQPVRLGVQIQDSSGVVGSPTPLVWNSGERINTHSNKGLARVKTHLKTMALRLQSESRNRQNR